MHPFLSLSNTVSDQNTSITNVKCLFLLFFRVTIQLFINTFTNMVFEDFVDCCIKRLDWWCLSLQNKWRDNVEGFTRFEDLWCLLAKTSGVQNRGRFTSKSVVYLRSLNIHRSVTFWLLYALELNSTLTCGWYNACLAIILVRTHSPRKIIRGSRWRTLSTQTVTIKVACCLCHPERRARTHTVLLLLKS